MKQTKYECYRCLGSKDCRNKAPKEGMCTRCSRRKYGGWLTVASIERVRVTSKRKDIVDFE